MDIKDQESLIKILDRAMTSDSDSVKESLQSLLVTVSLIHADDKHTNGPLQNILISMKSLQEQVADLKYRLLKLEENNVRQETINRTTQSLPMRKLIVPKSPTYENWDSGLKKLLDKYNNTKKPKT